jgi:predicted dehydrogenase
MKKVRWGVLSTASIGTEKVIPAMRSGEYCEVTAIASRDLEKAQAVARQFSVPKAYGSYEELLTDPEIDALYIPLPNPLHLPWSIKALEAGKHVLCEKPIGLSAGEAQELLDAAKEHSQLKVMEAFMYRHHPQWQRARQLVADGEIGELGTIQSFFSFCDVDPDKIFNIAEFGGGALMDIGCYCISLSRFIFDAEPLRVCGIMEYDYRFKVDRLTSGILDFGTGTSTFSCSTQLPQYEGLNILGTEGRVEIEIPFTPPADRPCKMWHQHGTEVEEVVLEPCDQYTIQGELFSQAVLNGTEVPTPLEDAVANMKTIEAIIRSAKSGLWV